MIWKRDITKVFKAKLQEYLNNGYSYEFALKKTLVYVEINHWSL